MGDLHLLGAVLYAAVGVLLFFAAFAFLDRVTPYHFWKEIVQERNLALAILVGAMSIGLCLIISAAVH